MDMFWEHLYIIICMCLQLVNSSVVQFVNSLVVEVGTDQTSYTVPEDVGQLEVWINITSGQKAPGQECEIEVVTTDGSAVGELIVTVCTVPSPVNDCDVL